MYTHVSKFYSSYACDLHSIKSHSIKSHSTIQEEKFVLSNWQKKYQTYVVSQFINKFYWTLEKLFEFISVQFSPVTRSCPSLYDAMDCSTPGFPVHLQLGSLLKLMPIELVMPSNHLILCHPHLLPPSTFPGIRVFSNEWLFTSKILELQL